VRSDRRIPRASGRRQRTRYLAAGIALVWVLSASPGLTDTADDWPDWVHEQERLEARIADVNEGQLAFLTEAPVRPVHHHSNRILISEASLHDGWVRMEQCHENLDRVAALQIVFNPERSRALRVTAQENVAEAFVDGHSVQLRDIGSESRVCIAAESRALAHDGEGGFELKNGPFMRRFLDGYYPLRVSLQVDYPPVLAFAELDPTAQSGFRVEREPGRIAVDALFEGQLRTRIRFVTR
jgi:hypothetical protein